VLAILLPCRQVLIIGLRTAAERLDRCKSVWLPRQRHFIDTNQNDIRDVRRLAIGKPYRLRDGTLGPFGLAMVVGVRMEEARYLPVVALQSG
jgi:hypothetical protein